MIKVQKAIKLLQTQKRHARPAVWAYHPRAGRDNGARALTFDVVGRVRPHYVREDVKVGPLLRRVDHQLDRERQLPFVLTVKTVVNRCDHSNHCDHSDYSDHRSATTATTVTTATTATTATIATTTITTVALRTSCASDRGVRKAP
ncbi:hypothetical protein EVAR_6961_1 [Eumeta japonica]|uniref:Uncharacterized protein n=1 Tax=Eumeta variegata TaxID=151549 RepID=A0A4C1TGJ8_EUMVA|nr:hypothetical protein EVAR_6961_1 [Eumeta japonica]